MKKLLVSILFLYVNLCSAQTLTFRYHELTYEKLKDAELVIPIEILLSNPPAAGASGQVVLTLKKYCCGCFYEGKRWWGFGIGISTKIFSSVFNK